MPLTSLNAMTKVKYRTYDGDECVADVDADGNPLRSYLWGPGIDDLLSMTVYSPGSTNNYYAVKDHLGSVHGLVDESGNTALTVAYDAWGTPQISSFIPHPSSFQLRYLFQGREWSYATGLYNFRARWYEPRLGRWLSNDPIGISGGLNLYEFCGNNPVNFADPDGLELVTHGDKRTEAALDAIDQALQNNIKSKQDKKERNDAKAMLDEFRRMRKGPREGGSLTKVTINITTGGNQWNPNNTIDWNPDCDTGGKDDKDGKRPPFIGLAHEIKHAIDKVTGQMGENPKQQPPKDPKMENRAEERAIRFENAVRNGTQGVNQRKAFRDEL